MVAAGLFTVHHVVALASYLDPVLTVLASSGVFVAGAVWGWMYGRYRSVWPPWIAHAFADVAIFVCGWWILFA
jgi:membrane protease YdiL (CAAX protease family)